MISYRLRPAALSLTLALSLSACVVGPKYDRPAVAESPAFKEAPNAQNGWVPSEPMDTIQRGAWWSVFGDPVLDGLEQKVKVSNQTVAQAVAAYDQARALITVDRAGYFPTVTTSGSGVRSGGGGGNRGSTTAITSNGTTTTAVNTGGGSYAVSSYSATLDASWAPDVWGRLRRQVQSDVAASQASAADLANATLSAQAELANDYLLLRVLDEEKRLYDDTAAADKRSYDITLNRYNAGVAAKTDVITAQTQWLSAQSQAIDVGVQRAQTEHAVAVLAGMVPSQLTIEVNPKLSQSVPTAPQILPSLLLQRRPDIAAAERRAAAASAEIGVQIASYYPTFNLTGSFGFDATSLGSLFNAANDVWSFGGNAAETLLDFGARKGRVRQARAAYAQAVAVYRQTTLTAFQQVEDQLVALRVLEQEAKVRDQELTFARQALALTLNQYKAGTVDYTTVVTAQNTALSAAESAISVLQRRQTASVTLIEALGGGWTEADLPKR